MARTKSSSFARRRTSIEMASPSTSTASTPIRAKWRSMSVSLFIFPLLFEKTWRLRRGGRVHAPDLPQTSVLIRIEFACSGHRHADGRQRVQDSNSAGVMPQHIRQTLVGLGCLVGIGSAQHDAALPDPTLHVVPLDPARGIGIVHPPAADPSSSPASRVATHHTAGPVDG